MNFDQYRIDYSLSFLRDFLSALHPCRLSVQMTTGAYSAFQKPE